MRRAVIVVCGTFSDWHQFQRCVYLMENEHTYLALINNDYKRLMGLEKYTTKVIRIGSWKKTIKEETEKFLMLFRG